MSEDKTEGLGKWIEWETKLAESPSIRSLPKMGAFKVVGYLKAKSGMSQLRMQIRGGPPFTVSLWDSNIEEIAGICRSSGHNGIVATFNDETKRVIFSAVKID